MVNNFIPEGVADLNYDEYEKIHGIENAVMEVFRNSGYRQISTPTFEYYDLFNEKGISAGTDDMYKIVDSGGKLMVLRPDATVPVARMMATQYRRTDGDVKLAYLTNVYRSADFRAGEKREFRQAGIEFFGGNSDDTDAGIIATAIDSLRAAGFSDLSTELGDTNYFSGLLEALSEGGLVTSPDAQNELRDIMEEKNIPALEKFIKQNGIPGRLSSVILEIPLLFGDFQSVTERALEIALNGTMKDAVENMRRVRAAIEKKGKDTEITADMGLVIKLDYYTGIIFRCYLKKSGVIVGGGGRYDGLMEKFGKNIPAAGFGINIDELYDSSRNTDIRTDDVLNIALGKGRLADITFDNLKKAGYDFPDYSKDSRKLIFEDSSGKLRVIFVKAVDVGIYVEKGACDVGVIGKDTLLESGSDVFEMMDLGYGRCIFAVAAPVGFKYDKRKKLRVATKYPRVAKEYFAGMGRSIEIIKINGSVELAPLVGLSDVIVDIVETGNTLKENGLEVVEEITDISARFIVNRASLKTREKQVLELIRTLESR